MEAFSRGRVGEVNALRLAFPDGKVHMRAALPFPMVHGIVDVPGFIHPANADVVRPETIGAAIAVEVGQQAGGYALDRCRVDDAAFGVPLPAVNIFPMPIVPGNCRRCLALINGIAVFVITSRA